MKDRPMMSRDEWAEISPAWCVDYANDEFVRGKYTDERFDAEMHRHQEKIASLTQERRDAFYARADYERGQARLRCEAKMAQLLDDGNSINATARALDVKWNDVASFAHKYRAAKIVELNERIAALELELSQYRG